jgi:hypothetical protein
MGSTPIPRSPKPGPWYALVAVILQLAWVPSLAAQHGDQAVRQSEADQARAVSADATDDPAVLRYRANVEWLADDARDGRGVGTPGLDSAAAWLEARYAEIGLAPAGDDGTFRHAFRITVGVEVGPETAFRIGGAPVSDDDYVVAGFSASDAARGKVVAAGYGITSEEFGIDDYRNIDVDGKIVLVRRFTPEAHPFDLQEAQRRYSDLRYKAFNAREHGAIGLIVVDVPDVDAGEMPDEASLPRLRADARGDAGIPVVVATRDIGRRLLDSDEEVELSIELKPLEETAYNIVGVVRAEAPVRKPGVVVVGAHYDHLGMGGAGSLAPGSEEPHNGADDNASGTAALLEAARVVSGRRGELQRDIYFIAFSGEELGTLGSSAITRSPPDGLVMDEVLGMINMDMVGRLRDSKLSVMGGESAAEWHAIVEPACRDAGIECAISGDGYGPSDHAPFFAAGVPVVHLFTGSHPDYHKPSDDSDKINAVGGVRIAHLAADVAMAVDTWPAALTYVSAPAPTPSGDVRAFGASLGTIPDYAGPEDGRPGVLLAGVRADSPAEKGGLQRGDLLVGLAGREIRDINDFMFILQGAKPGEAAVAVVERGGERVELEVVFGERRSM